MRTSISYIGRNEFLTCRKEFADGTEKDVRIACPVCGDERLAWDNWHDAKTGEPLRMRCLNGHVFERRDVSTK
jgi:hypothetical protein